MRLTISPDTSGVHQQNEAQGQPSMTSHGKPTQPAIKTSPLPGSLTSPPDGGLMRRKPVRLPWSDLQSSVA